jgi:hypothetical protein
MEKLKQLMAYLSEKGVPLALIRDPLTQKPSVSLTMLVISFTLAILSLLNKFVKIVDGMDVDNTLELLIITASLYFGRSLSKKMDVEKKNE